jgi:serine/threonine protein kinase
MAKYAGNDIYDPVNKAGGTLLFQAPEQALSVAYSKPVDVWA